MAKINQEEYEVLKELDDKWKWIARTESRAVKTFLSKPRKRLHWLSDGSGSWDIKGNENFGIYTNYADLYQFIQWEDEDPYNISELIEEYEFENVFSDKEQFEEWYHGTEREEAEVKNMKWFKKKLDDIEVNTTSLQNHDANWMLNRVHELYDQLEDPEVTLDRAFEKVAERYFMTKGEIWRHLERLEAHGGKATYGEPEVLSQEENINIVLDDLKEHIKEQQTLSQNVGLAHTSALNDTHYRQYDYVLECINEYEPSEDLQNLLVPKQEDMFNGEKPDEGEVYFAIGLGGAVEVNVARSIGEAIEILTEHDTNYSVSRKPVIPKFVAEWIESRDYYNVYKVLQDLSAPGSPHASKDIRNWIFRNQENVEKFVRAWLDGYTVEEEQKYYVMNNDNRMMLVRMMDGKTITEADPFKLEDMYEGEKKSHRLTEQEIKDYDPRYWAFRKPVEEMEK